MGLDGYDAEIAAALAADSAAATAATEEVLGPLLDLFHSLIIFFFLSV